ncbi:hypothetical protein K466DRAFT_590214 [Polyporus arcularius HHB13444]|uniref:Uncharacterized protein n=1 Tax=Polyporus arcularius HHB13444 TaxID=1314778 RepID=A0A5C3NZS4_9APHY|nr:hypothetical protein K466DRAFT_590214 [Polyporus arcularius HHB13444]
MCVVNHLASPPRARRSRRSRSEDRRVLAGHVGAPSRVLSNAVARPALCDSWHPRTPDTRGAADLYPATRREDGVRSGAGPDRTAAWQARAAGRPGTRNDGGPPPY